MNDIIQTSRGRPLPLGAHLCGGGACFSIFSRHAKAVTLVIFDDETRESPYREINLDPEIHKTGDIWHIWVEGVSRGRHYGYLIDGPYEPAKGHRFNRNRLILDPYARAVSNSFTWDLKKTRGFDPEDPDFDLSFSEESSIPWAPRGIVMDEAPESDHRALNTPPEESVIYELHVRGFTMDESSGVRHRGTYLGLTEKIPYLKDLGVTAVEFLPVQEFDEFENINVNPETGETLKNYWGYSTLSFYSPKGNYAFNRSGGGQVEEFQQMVRAFHEAGIEVILDVVFNHTAEGDEKGPTVSFRGIDNTIYYILKEDRRFYKNFSGCGNTFNCNHPLVRDFILNCLRYWVVQMKVDGFRFDLASILGRDTDGTILSNPPLIEWIEEDPILRNTKIIAEAWDAAGAYQVGSFPGRWAEWNGKYRDDVRRFWRGDQGSTGDFATRVTGSSDLYADSRGGPCRSINFVTCHDGFTLYDLVSYKEKHNIQNGEDNRDGENHNLSRNFGVEGTGAAPRIEALRTRMIKNFIATLMVSQGIPMILAGDELKRSQGGNNNTYCQDNAISWINWKNLDEHRDIHRFTKEMIRFRKEHPALRRDRFFTGNPPGGHDAPDIQWLNHEGKEFQWSSGSRDLCMVINGSSAGDESTGRDDDIYVIFNGSTVSRYFQVPESPSGRPWKRAVDTSLESPRDIPAVEEREPLEGTGYHVNRLSTVIFTA